MIPCMYKKTIWLQKIAPWFSILPSKAEEGWKKPGQYQANSVWSEITQYVKTLQKASEKMKVYCDGI